MPRGLVTGGGGGQVSCLPLPPHSIPWGKATSWAWPESPCAAQEESGGRGSWGGTITTSALMEHPMAWQGHRPANWGGPAPQLRSPPHALRMLKPTLILNPHPWPPSSHRPPLATSQDPLCGVTPSHPAGHCSARWRRGAQGYEMAGGRRGPQPVPIRAGGREGADGGLQGDVALGPPLHGGTGEDKSRLPSFLLKISPTTAKGWRWRRPRCLDARVPPGGQGGMCSCRG